MIDLTDFRTVLEHFLSIAGVLGDQIAVQVNCPEAFHFLEVSQLIKRLDLV